MRSKWHDYIYRNIFRFEIATLNEDIATKRKMKSLSILLVGVITMLVSCSKKRDVLTKIYEGEFDEVGVPSGYVNGNGDTIIPIGKYYYCFSNTMENYGIVWTHDKRLIGIDRDQNELFNVFWFDNGPDELSDGLIRIVKNNKIGFADSEGKIVIEPNYD